LNTNSRQPDSHARNVNVENGTLLTVERGLQVLRAFRSERSPLSNAELVKRTGLPKATVSRLTSTLLNSGFLRLVPCVRGFELSTGILGVGRAYLANSELSQIVQPVLQKLADELEVSTALAIRDGLDMLYIGHSVSHKVATLRLGIGSVLPMSTTAIGRAYLWALPEKESVKIITELCKRAGPLGAELEHSIRETFSELDSSGMCAIVDGYQRGIYGLALPLHVGVDQRLMCLSCGKADSQPDLRSERLRIGPTLKQAAKDLEAGLAGVEGLP